MDPVQKASINALTEALKAVGGTAAEQVSPETAADFINALIREPDKKKRKAMMKDYAERHKDAAKFLRDNAELINAEAEMALISAAVGSSDTEREVSYKGGRKRITEKVRKRPPNAEAVKFLLKNRMPDKYSDKPVGDVEIEDISDIEEELYGTDNQKDDTV